MKSLDVLSLALLIVGGFNWGLWGLLEFDFVATVFGGNTSGLSKIVYVLVGAAALYQLVKALLHSPEIETQIVTQAE